MDPGIVAALCGAGGAVLAGAVGGPALVAIVRRRTDAALGAAQKKLAEAQAEQTKAQTDVLRQDVYQQLTEDLRVEIGRVRADLETARTSLRLTSDEAERLRHRVLELESRVVHLSAAEAELRIVQGERDRLRTELAARDATIIALTGQIGDLKAQLGVSTRAA